MRVLDVGCGSKPRGDVNVDLRNPKYACPENHFILDAKKIPNFVNADAEHLPFRNSVFDLVTSEQVIEHVDNPILMLKELIRVSKSKIEISCPHRFWAKKGEKAKRYHKNFFTLTWFEQTLNQLNRHRHFFYTINAKYRSFPHKFLAIVQIPVQIQIRIQKIHFKTKQALIRNLS